MSTEPGAAHLTDLVLQGIATSFDRPFVQGGKVLMMKSGCVDASLRSDTSVRLLLDHDEKHCLATSDDRLELYAGTRGLAFRYRLPDRASEFKFSEIADDMESYAPVSIGYTATKKDNYIIDGVTVTCVVEAKLCELSILSRPPAVHATYARVVSLDSCGSLKNDYETGRLELVGKVISLHRDFKASENGGVIKYSHFSSPYDLAASRFERALQNLA